MRISVLVIISSFCIFSCHSRTEKRLPLEKNTVLVNSLEIENKITDSIDLELGEIADNLQIIRLETLEPVVMGGIYNVVLDKDYIVIGTEREYFLFDRKGRFIRRLLKTGRGPGEFNSPIFSLITRNGNVYVYDYQRKKYIYRVDLKSGKLDQIPRPNTGEIQFLIPDTDSTLLVFSQVLKFDHNSRTSATIENSLIRQDFNGNILKEISLGVLRGVFPFLPNSFSVFINENDTLISNPRFDTLYRFSNFKVQPVWQNIFKTNYNSQLSEQKIPHASLVHYSDSSILLWKSSSDISIGQIWSRLGKLLIMDRVNNKVKVIKKLYFKDSSMPIMFRSDIKLGNDQFCIVIRAMDIDRMLKNPLISKSVADIIVSDIPRTSRGITDYDNPFLLIGRFK